MSSQYINQNKPQSQINGRLNNIVLDGNVTVNTTITHGNIPNANIVQGTSITTAIDASSVANPYNFNVATFPATTASGGQEYFLLNIPPSIIDSFGFASIYVYYYGGVVGTAGYPLLSILTADAPNNRFMLLLENKHPSNALNGSIHFRFKYERGVVA